MGNRVSTGRTLTAFQNGRGWSYLDVGEIVGISAPVKGKGGFAESRRVMIRGGGIDYILNTPENFAQVSDILPDADAALWTPVPAAQGAGGFKARRKGGKLAKRPQACNCWIGRNKKDQPCPKCDAMPPFYDAGGRGTDR
jgi:hypothetical protein